MKKRLAQWFLQVAKRFDPDIYIENAQVVEDYEAKKIGLTYVITKKDIKNYRFKEGARMSVREAKRCIFNDTRKNIRKHIIGCIDANRLIEYETVEKDGDYRVSGELKVYIQRPKTNEENQES